MPDAVPDDAKAKAWDWLVSQLEFLHEVDRDMSRRELAGYLHFSLEGTARHADPGQPLTHLEHALQVADFLGGIATAPDELKPSLRIALQDEWSGSTPSKR